jgi:hypothetical protein
VSLFLFFLWFVSFFLLILFSYSSLLTSLLSKVEGSPLFFGGVEFVALPTYLAPRYTPLHSLGESSNSFSSFPWHSYPFLSNSSFLNNFFERNPLPFSVLLEARMPCIEAICSPSHPIDSLKTRFVLFFLLSFASSLIATLSLSSDNSLYSLGSGDSTDVKGRDCSF